MIFTETKLKGAFVIDLDRKTDERGFFARAFCQKEFRDHGLTPVIAQANVAWSAKKGTLRGMHFQYPPAAESKLVRCTRGAILDIIVDLRPESPTYLEHISVELDEDNMTALYVPERFAHGFQALRHVHAGGRKRAPPRRSAVGAQMATAGLGDITEGSGVPPIA
jgi:dTDP-4-dehydrorhamnose 3,5-epimerase